MGVLGEFDALPGISQKALPTKEAYEEGGGGHGCGHNLFGVGSLAAAISIKELIEQGKLKGTIKFFGTPAEESGNGKVYMAREGLFNDLDLCFDWHPGTLTEADTQSSTAVVEYTVEFFGKAAHAAGDPDKGKQLAYTCTGCHGIEGYKNAYPNYHVPRIAGQNYDYLLAALTAYKKGERNHPTMRAQAQSFTDEDIQNLAAFISGAKATEK